jgi:hypothetical protein
MKVATRAAQTAGRKAGTMDASWVGKWAAWRAGSLAGKTDGTKAV